ncbi:MAG: bifunctional adenosylcobinamide kinase/adenosylcobinamide-phosphate guanylyltransferase [Proteobacteria bacterium]|nr:MAG: bifunctional adenosylcobinamide kinase/adenosylcobinamide-phosphate guanylyltransferase [Pseudomonadota bacterium]
MSVTLILGGARSGKSGRAEALAEQSLLDVVYIATSPQMQDDSEWQRRIQKHQQGRPKHWQTLEEPLDLCGALNGLKSDQCALVDCLTLWLFNIMSDGRNIESETERLCTCLDKLDQQVFLVSNELGMGLVPEQKLGRDFRDAQGRLNQAVAKVASNVELVVAGIPMLLKEKL